MKKKFFSILLCILVLACGRDQKKQSKKKKVKSEFLQTFFYDFKEEFSGNCDTIAALKNWKYYHDFKKFLSEKYLTTNMQKAMLFSDKLADLTASLKDSTTIAALDNKSFLTRLNVLETQVLRLKDMAKIKSITAQQVSKQVQKIFSVHDALVTKINDIYATQALDKKIELNETPFYLYNTDNTTSE